MTTREEPFLQSYEKAQYPHLAACVSYVGHSFRDYIR